MKHATLRANGGGTDDRPQVYAIRNERTGRYLRKITKYGAHWITANPRYDADLMKTWESREEAERFARRYAITSRVIKIYPR